MSETQTLTDAQRLADRTNALLHPTCEREGGEAPAACDEQDPSLLSELAAFVHEERAYWLTPLIATLCLLSGVIVFAEGSALAPFVYFMW